MKEFILRSGSYEFPEAKQNMAGPGDYNDCTL